jgi:hypothetical protein
MALAGFWGRRWAVVGVVVGAAVVSPVVASLSGAGSPDRPQAACLSWLGSMNDGTCMAPQNQGDPDNGNGPQVGFGGPNSGNPGLSTGPLFPGQTFNTPLG